MIIESFLIWITVALEIFLLYEKSSIEQPLYKDALVLILLLVLSNDYAFKEEISKDKEKKEKTFIISERNSIAFSCSLFPILFLSRICNLYIPKHLQYSYSMIVYEKLLLMFWLSVGCGFILCFIKHLRRVTYLYNILAIVSASIVISARISTFSWSNHLQFTLFFGPRNYVAGLAYIILHLTIWLIVLKNLLSLARSFSYGEANIISQLLTHAIMYCIDKSFARWNRANFNLIESEKVYINCAAIILGIILMGFIISFFKEKALIFPVSFAVVVVLTILWVNWIIQQDPLTWSLGYISTSWTRMLLVVYWLVFGGLMFLLLLIIPTDMKVVVRKYFHLLISLMLAVPLIFGEEDLTIIAFSVTFCGLLLIELARSSQIPKLSESLTYFIDTYRDQKDTGIIVTSHFYLLLGFSLPLVFHSSLNYNHLSSYLLNFSGLLTIGVADSLSSIFGSLYGKHKWSPTNPKSFEGTFAGFIGIFLFNLLIIVVYSCTDTWFSLHRFLFLLISSLLVCIMEAVTDQIDNLFLPFYYFALINLSLSI